MFSKFFTGEKEKSIVILLENCWTHIFNFISLSMAYMLYLCFLSQKREKNLCSF